MRRELIIAVIGVMVAPITYAQKAYEKTFSHFEVLKLANGKAIEIDGNYCKPTFFDFNGDGKDDLLTGEFGTISCPKPISISKGFVEGRGRIFINSAKTGWSFEDYKWLMDKDTGRPLYLPVT